jgi:hypothetical protein
MDGTSKLGHEGERGGKEKAYFVVSDSSCIHVPS